MRAHRFVVIPFLLLALTSCGGRVVVSLESHDSQGAGETCYTEFYSLPKEVAEHSEDEQWDYIREHHLNPSERKIKSC